MWPETGKNYIPSHLQVLLSPGPTAEKALQLASGYTLIRWSLYLGCMHVAPCILVGDWINNMFIPNGTFPVNREAVDVLFDPLTPKKETESLSHTPL